MRTYKSCRLWTCRASTVRRGYEGSSSPTHHSPPPPETQVFGGLIDSFVVLKWDTVVLDKSSVVSDNLNPRFDLACQFKLGDAVYPFFAIEIWDKTDHADDRLISSIEIPKEELVEMCLDDDNKPRPLFLQSENPKWNSGQLRVIFRRASEVKVRGEVVGWRVREGTLLTATSRRSPEVCWWRVVGT